MKLTDGRFGGKVEVYRPTVAPVYNDAMPGTDIGDQKTSYCSVRRKSLKWTHKLIYRLFRQTYVNAEILFNDKRPSTKKRLSLLQILQQSIHDWKEIEICCRVLLY